MTGIFKSEDILFFGLTILVAASVSFAICFWWIRREQRRVHRKMLAALASAHGEPGDMFLTGMDVAASGELIAQFKVNHGKRVVSLVESGGKRFIHVDGELSTLERANMVRYLKSEGFMS